MGWLFTCGLTRRGLIADRIQKENSNGTLWQCLAHCLKGNVLWTVWEITRPGGKQDRFIGCDLLRCQPGYGWGYKDMTESVHPYYYSCPIKYLEMVPEVANEEWRQRVRVYREKYRRKLQVGKIYQLISCAIPEITVTRLRPLRGTYAGRTYRLSKRLIGKETKPDSSN